MKVNKNNSWKERIGPVFDNYIKVVSGFSEYYYNSGVIRKFYNNVRCNREEDGTRGNLRIQMS